MQQAVTTRPRVFYGWWIILGAFTGSALSAGFNFHGISAFFLPIASAFNVSRTAVATAFSLARIEGALIGPVEGYLVDRYGPRRMMFIGVPIMAAGFLVMGSAPNFPLFVGAFILGVVLGSSLGFGIPLSTSVANWWHRKRGRAFGSADRADDHPRPVAPTRRGIRRRSSGVCDAIRGFAV